jgi:hypothetical protein
LPRIFVCYRREDTFHITGRLGDRLRARYGADNVFVDVNSNEAGVEYQRTTLAALRASDIVLVVIGDRWLGGRGFFPARRGGIHSPQSLARAEIEAALQARIPIVPVLVDGARMPGVRQLPVSIAGLSGIHARRLDAGEDFDHHTRRLIERIDAVVAKPSIAIGPVAEGPAREKPVPGDAALHFIPAPVNRLSEESPDGPRWFTPDQSADAPLQSAPDLAAPDSGLRVIDRNNRLRIAGATTVLVLPVMAFGVLLFFVTEWGFLGLTGVDDNKGFSSVVATSALIMVFIAVRCRRWSALDRLELAFYWLAASAPVIVAPAVLSLAANRPMFGLEAGSSGLAVGSCIVTATGLFLLARHWNDWVERELPIYWLGCSASSLTLAVLLSRAYFGRPLAGMSLLLCVLELFLCGLLVWWRHRSLTFRDYVIFCVGAVPLGALTLLIFK